MQSVSSQFVRFIISSYWTSFAIGVFLKKQRSYAANLALLSKVLVYFGLTILAITIPLTPKNTPENPKQNEESTE